VHHLGVGSRSAARPGKPQNVNTARAIGSAILAVIAWPLLFLGINLHIHP
jgi:hypothetical protein